MPVLSDSLVVRLLASNTPKPFTVKDDLIPCLSVRIGKRDATFVLDAVIAGKRLRVSLGAYPKTSFSEARHKAWHLVVGKLDAPAVPEHKDLTEKITFGELLKAYQVSRSLKPSTAKGYEKALKFIECDALDVGSLTADSFLTIYQTKTKHMTELRYGCRVIKALTRWHNARYGTNYDDPTRLISALTGESITKTNARDRRLLIECLPSFMTVLSLCKAVERDAVMLALLTGLRKSELLGLTVEQVQGGFIRLPDTKSGRAHSLPLVGQAKAIVESRLITVKDGRIFPIEDARRTFRLLADVGIELSWHDLRRSWASFAVACGVSEVVIKSVLNHADHGVTQKHYARVDVEQIKQALNVIDDYLLIK